MKLLLKSMCVSVALMWPLMGVHPAAAAALPVFSENVELGAEADGSAGTYDNDPVELQSDAPFGLSTSASISGEDDSVPPFVGTWSADAHSSGGFRGGGLFAETSASASADGDGEYGVDSSGSAHAVIYVNQTVIVHLSDPLTPATLDCISTVHGTLESGNVGYSLNVADDTDNFSASANNSNFVPNQSSESVSSGLLTGISDGTVLNIAQSIDLSTIAGAEDTGSDSSDDDFGDTFWLQLLPVTPGVTLESVSGTDYTQPYTSVPEPSSAAVFFWSRVGYASGGKSNDLQLFSCLRLAELHPTVKGRTATHRDSGKRSVFRRRKNAKAICEVEEVRSNQKGDRGETVRPSTASTFRCLSGLLYFLSARPSPFFPAKAKIEPAGGEWRGEFHPAHVVEENETENETGSGERNGVGSRFSATNNQQPTMEGGTLTGSARTALNSFACSAGGPTVQAPVGVRGLGSSNGVALNIFAWSAGGPTVQAPVGVRGLGSSTVWL